MSGSYCHNFGAALDPAGMENRRRKPRVITVEFRLTRPVRIHLKQRLRIKLTPVIIFPPGIKHTPIRSNSRKVSMNRVKAQTPKPPAIFIASVKITHLRPPAVNNLNASRGIKNYIAIRKIRSFIIGKTKTECQLPNIPARRIHLVQMIIILAIRLFPRKQNTPPVIRNIRIANNSVGILDKRPDFSIYPIHLHNAETRTRRKVTLILSIGLGLGISIMRTAKVKVFRKNNLRAILKKRTKKKPSPSFAGLNIQIKPTTVFKCQARLA